MLTVNGTRKPYVEHFVVQRSIHFRSDLQIRLAGWLNGTRDGWRWGLLRAGKCRRHKKSEGDTADMQCKFPSGLRFAENANTGPFTCQNFRNARKVDCWKSP